MKTSRGVCVVSGGFYYINTILSGVEVPVDMIGTNHVFFMLGIMAHIFFLHYVLCKNTCNYQCHTLYLMYVGCIKIMGGFSEALKGLSL